MMTMVFTACCSLLPRAKPISHPAFFRFSAFAHCHTVLLLTSKHGRIQGLCPAGEGVLRR
jgi:hypothetical protein